MKIFRKSIDKQRIIVYNRFISVPRSGNEICQYFYIIMEVGTNG